MIRSKPLWFITLLALVLGVAVGNLLPQASLIAEPLGQLFLQALKMLVVPLVLVSITHAVGSVSNVGTAGRMGVLALLGYLITTFMVIPTGFAVMSLVSVNPMPSLGQPREASFSGEAAIELGQLIPANIIDAMASGNILGLIVFSLLLGMAANRAGPAGLAFREFMASAMVVVQGLTKIIIAFAPIGVFSLMASTTAQYGLDVLRPLVQLILLVYLGCVLHVLITLNLGLRLFAQLSLWRFTQGVFPAQLMAFSTTTAAGTLPESMRCAEENLQVKPYVSRFVLPVGATMNMDGTALYQLMVSLFVAQWYGIQLDVAQLVTLSFTVVLMSVGTAAIPSGGLVVLSAVLASVGLPIEAVALVAGIDRVLDMARTTVNVTGDLAVTTIIDRQMKRGPNDV